MRVILGATLTGVLLLLAGCGEPAPTPTPTDAASEPVFASEEEALAAAEEVFGKFLDAETAMANSGGTETAQFDGLVTENQLTQERESAQGLIDRGRHMVGAFSFFNFELQQLDQNGPPTVFLQAYACIDLSNVKYVDSAGQDLTQPGSATALPYEIAFVNEPSDPSTLLIDQVIAWTGDDFC